VRFLEAVPGLRNRAALTTAYGAGLRVGEVARLTTGAIDSQRMLIRVEQGKGSKDRHVMLSPQLLQILRAYWRLARPGRWLFEAIERRKFKPLPAERFVIANGSRRGSISTTTSRSTATSTRCRTGWCTKGSTSS
jgi:integrase